MMRYGAFTSVTHPMRDPACLDCRGVANGDCGRHPALTFGPVPVESAPSIKGPELRMLAIRRAASRPVMRGRDVFRRFCEGETIDDLALEHERTRSEIEAVIRREGKRP